MKSTRAVLIRVMIAIQEEDATIIHRTIVLRDVTVNRDTSEMMMESVYQNGTVYEVI